MPEKKRSFEASLQCLEEVVQKLEAGDLALDDSLRLFEEGIKASNECRKTLEEARKRVQKLVAENGGFRLEALDGEEA
ncbi:MAG: exodeoxyribonuclease VII small subunit [Candidatus Latescibacteria bacterium]|nr:exodeoxyribonuclease VII small subunit [Candidatus Latescibacterota bacterium]